MLENTMLEKKIWAVIGANQNKEKFGNKIFNRLKAKGYEVFPVNPLYDEIGGEPCFRDISSLPKVPDVINIVVSPKRVKPFLNEAVNKGVKYVWFQPGTYDDEVIYYAKDQGLEIVKACVLIAIK